jgi:hypothetical protein
MTALHFVDSNVLVYRHDRDSPQDHSPDATPSARTLAYPNGIAVVRDKLIVSDNTNSRFLVFESQ